MGGNSERSSGETIDLTRRGNSNVLARISIIPVLAVPRKTNRRFVALLNQGLWGHALVLLAHLVRNVLLHAVRSHNHVGLQRLLARGVKEQMGEALCIDIIHCVAVDDSREWLRTLLDCDVDPGIKYSDSWTISSRTTAAGRANVVQIPVLARHDVDDVNVLDKTGKWPLSIAARNGHKEVVELLLGYAD